MSTLELHSKLDRKEVLNELEDNIATMEANIYGAMFLLQEAHSKEVPTAYALWRNLEQLKESVARVRILELKNSA